MPKYLTTFILFTFCFLFLSFNTACSQTIIQGVVKDMETQRPLPYCAIAIKGTTKGCITNLDGFFKISAATANDTLYFAFLGFKRREIPAISILKNPEILLEENVFPLKEVVVKDDDDFLYTIVQRCRKNMSKTRNHISKAYFELETESSDQPTEMLQCYYNGYMNGINIERLSLKNGRVALAPIDSNYFVSLDISSVISAINLTGRNDDFPSIPLQFTISKLKKHYRLRRLPVNNTDSMYHIEFTPDKNDEHFFKGDVWIDKTTFAILKINLLAKHTPIHPLIPIFPDDSISDVSMRITKTFTKTGNTSVLNHIDFRYKLNYTRKELSTARIRAGLALSGREIKTQGVMYFYDYENPFRLPFFEYDPSHDDYRKISFLPYNDFFWRHGSGLITTEKQKQNLSFFENNGLLFNYTEGQIKIGKLFLHNNILWSETKRISLEQDIQYTDTLSKDAINQSFKSDLYNLKVQIFFDANESEDSINHYSATVLDVFQTYYNLPKELYTGCFINIFFDICEIERRKMEDKLNSKTFTLSQLDSVYQEAVKEMDIKTKIYLKEVQLGKNSKLLEKWNKYVYEELGIDNFKLYNLSEY